MSKIIEDVGTTTAPRGCEPYRVWITDKRLEPIEVVGGCIDFRLAPNEAIELGDLLIKAAVSLGGKRRVAGE